MRAMRFAQDLRTVVYVAAGVFTGLSLGFFAELLGARQGAQYKFEMTDVSGFGFVLWLFLLCILFTSGKAWIREHSFETGIVCFYFSTYWFIEVTARIFESGLIIVLLAGLTLKGWRRQAFLGINLGLGVLIWGLRMGKPALGYAVG